MMNARTLMLQGTSSGVGKSMIITALCRLYTQRGFCVAPFKSQAITLDSFINSDGMEIDRNQALQAMASYRDPKAEMNPILLKKGIDSQYEMFLLGKIWKKIEEREYIPLSSKLWGKIKSSMDKLRSSNDLIIAEGSGNSAELGFSNQKIDNMCVAKHLNSPVILVSDNNCEGSFASIAGTLSLLNPANSRRVKGFIINKSKSNPIFFEKNCERLTKKIGNLPNLGVIPRFDTDFLSDKNYSFLNKSRFLEGEIHLETPKILDIAVPHFPNIANYDDLDALKMEQGVSIRFIDHPSLLGIPDAILLPGTNTTQHDLHWLRQSGLADAIVHLASEGIPVAGFCGGYQMLGWDLVEGYNSKGKMRRMAGLGLLDIHTIFDAERKTRIVSGRVLDPTDTEIYGRKVNPIFNFLAAARNIELSGCEIRLGKTILGGEASPLFSIYGEKQNIDKNMLSLEGAVAHHGSVWGTSLHGVFDAPEFRRTWLESLGWEPVGAAKSLSEERERKIDRITNIVSESLDIKRLDAIIGF